MTGYEAIEFLKLQGVHVAISGDYCEARVTASMTIKFKHGEDLGAYKDSMVNGFLFRP